MMDKGIRKVRNSIKRRKKIRDKNEGSIKQALPYLATDEEKYGFESPFYDIERPYTKKQPAKKEKSTTPLKVAISIALFLVVSFLSRTELPNLQPSKKWMNEALQNEFPFAKVNEWYVTTLGEPLSITPQGNVTVSNDDKMILPVMGDVVETFATNGSGIKISPEEKSNVSAIDKGVVIFAGNDKKTGKTIVIQHADNSETTYGHLSTIDVHLYQIVHANEVIATFQPTEQNEFVYFSIEKDNKFIDPTQVIPVDDIP